MEKSKALASLKAFLSEESYVIKIIELCNLYPVENSWKKWTDHLGNFITIYKNKKVNSSENQFKKSKKIQVTDIFYKTKPLDIAKKSKQAFIAIGKNSQKNQIVLVWFLGKDDRLRLVISCDGKWIQNHPPMICGIETLHTIVNNLHVTELTEIPALNITGAITAEILKSWATPWPLLEKNIEIKQALKEIYETK